MEQALTSPLMVSTSDEQLSLPSHATSESTLPIQESTNTTILETIEEVVHLSNSNIIEAELPVPSTSNHSSPSSSPTSNGSPVQPARRVKLYRLLEDQWIDLGTGNCMGILIDASTQNDTISEEGAWIIVSKEGSSSEGKPAEVLLRSLVECGNYMNEEEEDDSDQDKVCNIGAYQKQQDTLIVWTDKDSDHEMALSFATTSGCAEIWQFIKHARKWQADQTSQRSPSMSPGILSPQPYPYYNPMITRIPELSLASIEEVENAIRALGRTAVGRERTALAIIKGEFIQKLIKIQVEAEDLESTNDLHSLCRVMQTILLLNDNAIFDLILRDEMILGVASLLEYDPEFPTMKASYKAHLSDPSHFTQVVPIRSAPLLAKIHQTHRLHYLKDVVLARILEDSTFSMLNSAIYFNEVDIVNEVAGDVEFLRELFGIFDDEVEIGTVPTEEEEEGLIGPQLPKSVTTPLMGTTKLPPSDSPAQSDQNGEQSMDIDTLTSPTINSLLDDQKSNDPSTSETCTSPPPDRRHDAILFLQQFCSMAKNLQLPLRAAFFRNLADKGLLKVIEVALSRPNTKEDSIMKSATVEILMNLVDHDPNNVRGYSLKQQAAGKRPLVLFLIELFHTEVDLGLKAQMAEALRVLVDAGGEGGPLEAPPRMRQEDPEAEKFLDYFYKNCILPLLAPILELSEIGTPDLSSHDIALCGHLCDLLCFFVSHHSFRSKYFVLSSSLSKHVSILFRTRHKHLKLAALRYFRACIGKSDDFYNRFLMKHDLFVPILDIAVAEKGKDNLLNSACLEFFEFIRSSNAKAVVNHLLEIYGEKVQSLAPTLKTFENLTIRWNQNNEPPPKAESVPSTATSKSMTREAGNWTRMEMEEESYFNGSDEEDESTVRVEPIAGASRKRESDSEESERKKVKILATEENGLPRSQTWPGGLIDSSKVKGKGLVDYGEEEDDSEGGFIKEIKRESTELQPDQQLIGPNQPIEITSIPETEEKPSEISTKSTTPPPPPLGTLRKQQEAEDEEGFGLLSAATKSATKIKKSIATKISLPLKISFGRSSNWSSSEIPKDLEESK